LPFRYTVAVAAAVAYLFAVYGCTGSEFCYVIFTKEGNFTTAQQQRKNGNGMVETGHNANFLFFLLFTAVTERNFLRNFYRVREFCNGRTAKR